MQKGLAKNMYAKDGTESGTRQQRAEALMKFYRDEEIKGIFDVSGGDLANGVLPWLDYETIAKSGKMFWGYSDLTTVVNAITAKTEKPSVLYQIRNLIYQDGEEQKCRFRSCLLEQNQRQGIGSTQNQTQKNRSLQSQSLPESLELVPMLKNSASAARRSLKTAAAGVSIMTP